MMRRSPVALFVAMPEVWQSKLKAAKAPGTAAAGKQKRKEEEAAPFFRPRPVPYDTAAMNARHGEWDAAAAAQYAFRSEKANEELVEKAANSKLLTAKGAAFHAYFFSLMPWYAMMWSTQLFLSASTLGGASMFSLACLYAGHRLQERVHGCVHRLRIIPLSTETPHGTEVELTVPKGFHTAATEQLKFPLESIRGAGANAKGEWVYLAVRESGRIEMYYLATCPNAHLVLPFIVSMKRHYEALEPEQPKLTLYQAAPNPTDFFSLSHAPVVHKRLYDVTVEEPYPDPEHTFVPMPEEVPPAGRDDPVLKQLWEEQAAADADAVPEAKSV